MSLVGKTYQWGSWDITFKEFGVLESVGGYIGTGKYRRTDNILEYNIDINKTDYQFKFVEKFNKFTSSRYKYNDNTYEYEDGNIIVLKSDSALVGNIYKWGSCDITFKENGVLESVGGYTGEGTYMKIKHLTYSINIKNFDYILTFDNEFCKVACKKSYDGVSDTAYKISFNPAL